MSVTKEFLRGSVPHIGCFAGPPLIVTGMSMISSNFASVITPYAMGVGVTIGLAAWYWPFKGKHCNPWVKASVLASTLAVFAWHQSMHHDGGIHDHNTHAQHAKGSIEVFEAIAAKSYCRVPE